MIKQNWIVNNEEKNRILNLHEAATRNLYLLKEQTLYTDTFEDTFESGGYELLPNMVDKINFKLSKLVDFIKNNKLKSFEIVITPGESRVTNQTGFEKVGSLAEKRAQNLKDYFEKSLKRILGYVPTIKINPAKIGDTPYKSGDKKNDPKYKKEQFIKVSIEAKKEIEQPKRESIREESIYINNRLVAIAEVPTTKNELPLNTAEQNVIFKVIVPDRQPLEFTAKYLVPWDWWNKNVGPSSGISQETFDDIITKFEKVN